MAAVSFAVARVRARPSRGLVTGLGIALAVTGLFVTAASPAIAGDATLRRTLESIPAGDRSVTVAVSVNSLTVQQLRDIDQQVRSTVAARGVRPPRAQVEYRALASASGTIFRLAGLDDLATTVKVVDGRLPSTCTPQRCEVVLATPAPALDLQTDLGIVVVGRVSITEPSALSGSFLPDPGQVLVLGDGVEAVSNLASLSLIGRSMGWVSAIDPTSIRLTDLDTLLAGAARATRAFSQGSISVTLPLNELTGARSRARAASSRVALAAAQGVVLLAAFVLLAAATQRRHHLSARRLLRQRGAGRPTCVVFTFAEATWPAVIGLTLGIPAGVGVATGLARRWNLDATDVVTHVMRAAAWPVGIAIVVLVVATSLVMASGASNESDARSLRPWWHPTAIDGLGLGALLTASLAVGRGASTPAELVSSGDPLLAALPILAAVSVAWVAVRLVPWLVTALAHIFGHRAPLVGAALGEVGRRPVLPLATAGFIAAATTLGVFSLGYRATLQAGAHDEAAYIVPYDLTLTEGASLVRPSALRPAGGWQSSLAGAVATDVLRRGGSVLSSGLSNDTVTLLGVDPQTLTNLHGWRSDFGPPLESLAGLVAARSAGAPLGSTIPVEASVLAIAASGDLAFTRIDVVIQRVDGTWHSLATSASSSPPVGPSPPSSSTVDSLVATLEPGDAGGRLIGFRLGQIGEASDRIQHHTGEGNTSPDQFTSAVSLLSVRAIANGLPASAGSEIAIDWDSLQSDGAEVTRHASGLSIALRLQGTSALVVPSLPAEAAAIPAIVDPSTAAAAQNGLVTIAFPNEARAVVRVVGVASMFPGAPRRFAVVDRSLAQPALDLLSPGLGTANETWIALAQPMNSHTAATLASAPFDTVTIQRRATIENRLRSDPLAVFTLGLFGVAALIAGALAAAAVYLSTLADAADQAPLHRALAADGVRGSRLSRMVRASALAIMLSAVLFGSLGALVLLRLVTRIISVTATATVPVPTLLARLPWQGFVLALSVVLVPSVLAATAAARSTGRVAKSDLLREFG